MTPSILQNIVITRIAKQVSHGLKKALTELRVFSFGIKIIVKKPITTGTMIRKDRLIISIKLLSNPNIILIDIPYIVAKLMASNDFIILLFCYFVILLLLAITSINSKSFLQLNLIGNVSPKPLLIKY